MTDRSFVLDVLKPFRWLIVVQLVANLIWAVHVSLGPYIIKIMIDRAATSDLKNIYNALIGPIVTYISLLVIVRINNTISHYSEAYLSPSLRKNIVIKIMDKMMDHSHHTFQNYFAGSLGNKVKDVMAGIPALLHLAIDNVAGHFIALFVALYTLALTNVKFAFGFSLWVGCFLAASYKAILHAKNLSNISAEKRSLVIGSAVDVLSNIANVRLFVAKQYEQENLNSTLNHYKEAEKRRDLFFCKLYFFQGFSFVVYQAFCFYWLISGLQNQILTSGDFTLVLMINVSVLNSLWCISSDFGSMAERYGDITQGLNVVLQEIEIVDVEDAKPLNVSYGEVIFDKVNFCYRNSVPLFNDLSITIKAGQKVGLVGYSGSGKSSFVNLILRLFDINSGKILIDGQDIKLVTQESLRQAIGVIPQEPALFHRSLIDNIRYGKNSASNEQVIEAAKAAHAHTFISKMQESYEALAGERGVKLSGGQRQRIAIARAFLKDAPILILDEATSQLDSVTENFIQDSLFKIIDNKTALIIAHRLSTLLNVDRILVFDHGNIIEDGTHEELLALNGRYRHLWDAQIDGFLPEKL